MNVVFMGTPDFAVPTLERLIEKHIVKAVVTQPDKPKGRGKKILYTPVKEIAVKNNIPVFQPEKIKTSEFIEEIKKIEADIFVVVAYGQILPESLLNIPKYGCINVHGSLLPKYRGAGPIQWSIINGEKVTGVTIMYMEKGLDTGDMILKKEIEISQDDTYGTLHDKMSVVGADALIETLELIEKGVVNPVKQDDSLSCYAPMLKKEDGKINWQKDSKDIINLIRGLNPWPSAYCSYNDDIFKIWKAEEICDKKYDNAEPGEIVDILNKKGFAVKTKDSAVVITEMQVKGGKKMSSVDYLRGHKIEKGIILN